MQRMIIFTTAILLGMLSATFAFAGGTEQDTPDGNKPAAESGGSGR